MTDFAWIVTGGVLMSAIALVGGVSTVLADATLRRLIPSMISLAAGTLMGGAFFHMIPAGVAGRELSRALLYVAAGFATFLALELFLQWHRCRRPVAGAPRPVTYLILAGDALHNFLGGLGIASTFLVDPRAGITAWIAGAAHEIPQELGDFSVLVHGGFSRRKALLANLLSALTFLVGAVTALFLSFRIDVSQLVLFGAGNFLYIAAADLVPEFKAQEHLRQSGAAFLAFASGVAIMFWLAGIDLAWR